jgi:hypothetical protein
MPASWCAVIRQSHLIAVVGAFLIAVVVVGCAGVRSEAPQEEQGHSEATRRQEQGYTEATEREARSPQATTEEARCEGTRTFKKGSRGVYTTNDVPGCPKGGLLSGTDKADYLDGKDGEDEIHSLGGSDIWIFGGSGNDVIYGGPGFDLLVGNGGDDVLYGGDGGDEGVEGGKGEDVIYGGDGTDTIDASGDGERDKLYCGAGGNGLQAAQAVDVGNDEYHSDNTDYVDSSCEKKVRGYKIVE